MITYPNGGAAFSLLIKTGNVLGIAGVTFGLASTSADMSLAGASLPAFEQAGLLAALGSGIGGVLASGVGPTELPQTVAAFHSLVGLAAMAGAAGEYFGNTNIDVGTLSAIYLATFIGGITATGSMIAYGKLAGMLSVSMVDSSLEIIIQHKHLTNSIFEYEDLTFLPTTTSNLLS